MSKRRPSGDGMVRHRSDGRWEGRIVIGHKPDGASVFRYVYAPTQKELTAKLHGEIEDCRGVDLKEKCKLTVEEWLTRWIDEYAAPRVRESTLRGYRLSIEKYIVPRIGERRLTALKERDLRRLYKHLLRDGRVNDFGGLSPTTVRKTHALLHRALDDAVKARLIPHNPADGITLPKGERPPLRVLTDAELTTFMDALEDDPWHDFFYLELTTGLRRGEICGLMWSDFDTSTGALKISRTLHMRWGGEVTVGEPKTATGVRKLLLPPSTAQLLRERKRAAVSQWIFPNPLHPERPINPGSAYTNLKRLLKKAGLPDIRFHGLRHTFATLSLEAGMDVKTLSAIIGHNSVSTTLNVYTHVTDTTRAQAATAIDKAITGTTAPTPAPEPEKPSAPFRPYKGLRRKPGTGCITQVSEHCYEGKYTPRLPNGTRYIKTVYAATREECETKLAALIAKVKPEVERMKREMKEGVTMSKTMTL